MKTRTSLLGRALLALLLVTGLGGAQEILFDKAVAAGGLTCFPVRGDEHTWYYLPDQAHLVVDPETGVPEFSFIMYVAPRQTDDEGITRAPGGGILHFQMAYDVPEDVVREAGRELARMKRGARLVGPVSFQEGGVSVSSSLVDSKAGFSGRVLGTGPAPVMAGHKASVNVHLSKKAAAILWHAAHTSRSPVSVAFEMDLSGYYQPVEARMVIDWEKVNQVIQAGAAGRVSFVAFEVDALLQKMMENGAITIELVGAPPSQWDDIRKIGLDLARSVLFERSGTASVEELQRLGGESLLDRYERGRSGGNRHSSLAPSDWPSGFPWAVGGVPPFWLRREACWRGLGLFPPETPTPEGQGTDRLGGCSESEHAEARRLFLRAVRVIRQREWDEGERLLNRAREHCDGSNIHWNLAEVARHRSPPQASRFMSEMEDYLSYYEGSSEYGERIRRSRRILSSLSASSSENELDEASNRLHSIWHEVSGRYRLPQRASIERTTEGAAEADAPSEHQASEASGTARQPGPVPSNTPRPTTSHPRARRRPSHGALAATPSPSGSRGRSSTAGHRRTQAPRLRRTPRPSTRAGGRSESSSGILARFRFRRVTRSGKMVLSLNQWRRVTRPVRFGADLGDLTRYASNPKLFLRVNIDDPVFKQREIPVTVDVSGEEAFARMLNSVTVTLRKRHQSGSESLDEVTIRRSHVAGGEVPKLLYGWDGDTDRSRWLRYEYRVRWAYVGGPEIDTGWQQSSAGALVLEPPLRPRTILLEGDRELLREAGVRHVRLDLLYDAAGIQRRATTTLKTSQLDAERRVVIYQPPDRPEYQYSLHWRFFGGRTASSGPHRTADGILYLDEIPGS